MRSAGPVRSGSSTNPRSLPSDSHDVPVTRRPFLIVQRTPTAPLWDSRAGGSGSGFCLVSGVCRTVRLRLAELVPADVLTWDRVTLATGAVCHEAVPAEASRPACLG